MFEMPNENNDDLLSVADSVADNTNVKGKGKGKATARIVEESDNNANDSGENNDYDEPSGRTRPGTKKSRIRSPQPGDKRRPPTSPSAATTKTRKRSRKTPAVGTTKAGPSSARATQDKGKEKSKDMAPVWQVSELTLLSDMDIESPPADAPLTVPEAAPSVTDPALDSANPPSDPILSALNAPGGQNDPAQDAEIAQNALRGNSTPEPPLSPLSDLSSVNGPQIQPQPSFSMPRRPTDVNATAVGVRPSTRSNAGTLRGQQIMANTHSGSLANNRDGSGTGTGTRGARGTRVRRGGRRGAN